MVPNERSSAFVTVTCSCGRGLRAKSDLVGTEVRCWDCHKMVLVPMPPQGQRVARELSSNVLTVIQGPGLNSVVSAAAVVTAVMAIPRFGAWGSVIVLAMGASAYGEIIRRVGRGPVDGERPGWLISLVPRSIPKFVLCVLMAAGTVVPLWLLNAGPQQSPHFDRAGWGVAASTWIVVPILMLMLFGRTEQDTPLGVRRSLKDLAKHPFATLLALAVVPITLVLVEATFGLIFYLPGNLPFYALDYMPMPSLPDQPVVFDGVAYYHYRDYRELPVTIFHKGYLDGIRQGYSFVGGIPASLSMSTRAGMKGEAIGLFWPVYPIARVLSVMVIVTCLLTAFAVQARWLGSIPALERRRTV